MRALLACVMVCSLVACFDLGGRPPDAGSEDSGDGPTGDGGPVVDVAIAGLAFRPKTIEIRRGTTVRWTNYDAVTHTVTEGQPGVPGIPVFDSPIMAPGDTFERTFHEPGEWVYYCRTHQNVMNNNIVRVL